MFESAQALPQRSRWTNVTALAVPAFSLLALVRIGLLHPALLPLHLEAPTLFVPPPPPPPVVAQRVKIAQTSAAPERFSSAPQLQPLIPRDRLAAIPEPAAPSSLSLWLSFPQGI